jgi:hypothetical protein
MNIEEVAARPDLAAQLAAVNRARLSERG